MSENYTLDAQEKDELRLWVPLFQKHNRLSKPLLALLDENETLQADNANLTAQVEAVLTEQRRHYQRMNQENPTLDSLLPGELAPFDPLVPPRKQEK